MDSDTFGKIKPFLKDKFETEHEKGIDVQEELRNLGGRKDLLMFLSGEGGSGKTTTIQAVWSFCKYFCSQLNIPFDNTVFRKTALSGSAASLFGGVTLHSACKLNSAQSNIS